MEHVFYYFLTIPLYILSFSIMVKKGKLELYRFGNHVLILSFFIYTLIAPSVYSGAVFHRLGFDAGFNLEVYFIYIAFSIFLNISYLVSLLAVKKIKIEFSCRKNNINIESLVFLFVFIYTILFIYIVGLSNLPNYSLLTDGFQHAYKLKFDLNSNSNLLISKFDVIIMPLLLYAFIFFFLSSFEFGRWYIFATICLFIFLFFYSTVRLSRGGILYYALACYFSYICYRNKKISMFVFFSLFSLIVIMFYLFSGVENITLLDSLENFIDRLSMQHAFIYLQVDLAKNIPFLNSINIPILAQIFSIEYVNPSKLVYDMFYSNSFSGSTAGLGFAQIYFSFSFWALIIWPLMMFLIFMFDGYLFESINCSKQTIRGRIKLISIYYMCHALLLISILTNMYTIFSFSLFFSPSFIYLLFLLSFVIKITRFEKE